MILECKIVLLLGRIAGYHEVKIYFFNDELLFIDILAHFMPEGKGSTIEDLHVNINAAFFELTPKLLRRNRHIHRIHFEVMIPSLQKSYFLRCLEGFLLPVLYLVDLQDLEAGNQDRGQGDHTVWVSAPHSVD